MVIFVTEVLDLVHDLTSKPHSVLKARTTFVFRRYAVREYQQILS